MNTNTHTIRKTWLLLGVVLGLIGLSFAGWRVVANEHSAQLIERLAGWHAPLKAASHYVLPANNSAATAFATLTVNNTGDGVDATPGNGVCETATGNGICTLRAAIQEANALAGTDMISFNVGGGGAQTITLGSALPTVTDNLTIDGSTQPGFSGTPLINLSAASVSSGVLSVVGVTAVLKSFRINDNPGAAVHLENADDSVIDGLNVS